ncbi:branched-chain amino acid ABC transporter permease [Haloarchaeobius sp. DYHT-AS-18]|uniref:branched-chain amino acid ABC transporter permease n=1 Tax=Haloarchaeobius sp. DYHT-AS-18 TaxID=3446117 RepID=UPI003EC119BD
MVASLDLRHRVTGGLPLLAVALGLAVTPVLFGWTIAGEVLVFAVFAVGYNLLLGYGGELSFGHAAFFGVGAYGTLLFTQHVVQNLYLGIIAGTIIAALTSVVIGVISLRRRGIYFAMITLALAQIVYYVVFQWKDVTGGLNGLSLPLFDASLGPIDPATGGADFFVFGFLVLVLVWFAVRRVVRSPFGRTLTAIRENEARARHLGYDVNRFLFGSFVISGAISGVAGGLYATLYGFVTPDILFWLISGEVVLITLLGGIGTLGGPVVGALVFLSLQELLTEHATDDWRLVFGAVIMLVVLFAPRGVYGLYESARESEDAGFGIHALLDRFTG